MPSSAEGHYGLGLVALRDQQNYSSRHRGVQSRRQTEPANLGDSTTRWANPTAKLKLYDDAIAAYLKEREKNGDDPDLENALADAYRSQGNDTTGAGGTE